MAKVISLPGGGGAAAAGGASGGDGDGDGDGGGGGDDDHRGSKWKPLMTTKIIVITKCYDRNYIMITSWSQGITISLFLG